MVSEDLDEIFELCDRIAVLYQGAFMGILDANDPRTADIGLMMAGSLNLNTEHSPYLKRQKFDQG